MSQIFVALLTKVSSSCSGYAIVFFCQPAVIKACNEFCLAVVLSFFKVFVQLCLCFHLCLFFPLPYGSYFELKYRLV